MSIPDPLKREIRPRSFGYHNKTRFSDRQGGRRDRHSGGRRDKHYGGRDRHQRYSDKKSYYGLRSRW